MTERDIGDEFRVREWDDFEGQEKLKERLDLHCRAVTSWDGHGEVPSLPSILLEGPPGYGKTSLAEIIAIRSGNPFYSMTMPVRPAKLHRFFSTFGGGVVLLDEVHASPRAQQEELQVVLLEGYYQGAKGKRIRLPWLTVIGATTEPHLLLKPFRERFKIQPGWFDPYTDEELGRIVEGMGWRIGVDLSTEDAQVLGRASGGTPRRAAEFLEVARALQRVKEPVTIDKILDVCRVDRDGLTERHRVYLRLLHALSESKAGVGLDRLASELHCHATQVREVERLLSARQLIDNTGASGRELTPEGYKRVRSIA